MITSRQISFLTIIRWSGHHIIWLLLVMGSIALLYHYKIISFSIPYLPVSIIGTAVAFFVGFKNNQSYDRLWEARKIWGAIVNESRSWGMMVDGYVSNMFTSPKISEEEIYGIKKDLIYRHIAWLYAHRSQLLVPTSWEHVTQGGLMAKSARFYQSKFGVGLIDDEVTRVELDQFLKPEEHDRLINAVNTATQIINEQSRHLQKLREHNVIDDFRHVSMTHLLKELYTQQGKNERIKKFPFPRQYANMSSYFTGIFITLLPFTLIPILMELGPLGTLFSVPVTALVGWVYVMMEVVGDYSENPFEGMANDIPMFSLCRTIEIDLRQMLNETDLPAPVEAKHNVLM